MLITQTIVVDITRGAYFEDENAETHEKEFIQTDFDLKISEFGDLVEKEGGQIVSIAMTATPEKLVAFIMYADKEVVARMNSRLTQANAGIPNLKLV
jgi:hypothetical protein